MKKFAATICILILTNFAWTEGFLPSGISANNQQHGLQPTLHKKTHPAGKPSKKPAKKEIVVNQKEIQKDLKEDDVDKLVDSEFGKQLYDLEVSLNIQKKKNELLKLKKEALQMTEEIEKTVKPQPAAVPFPYSYPSVEKGYFSPGAEIQPILKEAKTKKFQVAMVEENKKALLRNDDGFCFVRPGETWDDAKITAISQNGLTLTKNGVDTFYPVSVIFPEPRPETKK